MKVVSQTESGRFRNPDLIAAYFWVFFPLQVKLLKKIPNFQAETVNTRLQTLPFISTTYSDQFSPGLSLKSPEEDGLEEVNKALPLFLGL